MDNFTRETIYAMKTDKEKIEQLAADIIHVSTNIQSLLDEAGLQGHRQGDRLAFRVRQSAKSIRFHAEGILKALEPEATEEAL